MPRRIALALSFTLTVMIAFAVASFASQAGWLQAQSDNTEAAAAEEPAQPSLPPDFGLQDPLVITEYVYQDIPVVVSRSQEAPPSVEATPEPTPVVVPAQVVSSSVSTSSDSGNAAVSQANQQPAPQLSWSHDGDGSDAETFSDEHQDEHQEHEHESEHEEHDD